MTSRWGSPEVGEAAAEEEEEEEVVA